MASRLDRPGIYEDIEEDEYHPHGFVSKSKLDVFNVSPYHYYRRYLKAGAAPRKPTPSMKKGSLIHLAVLEPERFLKEVIVGPGEHKGKKEWKDFVALFPDLTVVKLSEYQNFLDIAHQISIHPIAKEVLSASRKEVSMSWIDPDTGLGCRGRADAFWQERMIISDVKTTTDASPEAFHKSIMKWRYHVQAAFYADGLAQITGNKIAPVFLDIAVETGFPSIVQIYEFPPYLIEIGRAEYKRNLKRLAECLYKKEWPGYGPLIMQADLPKYYKLGSDDDGSESDDSADSGNEGGTEEQSA